LGREYKHNLHSLQGIAVSRTEYLTGCARVRIEKVEGGDLKAFTFDEPELIDVKTGHFATEHSKPGGPRPGPAEKA
jgi:hypothetical protein